MLESNLDVNQRIAARVRQLRSKRGLSLDGLAGKSGVSRSMISVIERGESSPTAVLLERLAAGLGVPLAALFDSPAEQAPSSPVARREEQTQWRDPASGYVRQNVSPQGAAQPLQIVEVHFPPGRRVAFESVTREVRVYQQIWVLEGEIEITVGDECHQLRQGDCLAMQLDGSTLFHNPTGRTARYAVVTASEPRPRKRGAR